MGQGLRHPVEEGLCPDEAMVGEQVGTFRQVLSAAEADLEMQRAIEAEQRLGRDRAVRRGADLRQQLVDQLLLAGAQRLALAAAIEPVERGRIAFLECRHGPRVSGVGKAGPDGR